MKIFTTQQFFVFFLYSFQILLVSSAGATIIKHNRKECRKKWKLKSFLFDFPSFWCWCSLLAQILYWWWHIIHPTVAIRVTNVETRHHDLWRTTNLTETWTINQFIYWSIWQPSLWAKSLEFFSQLMEWENFSSSKRRLAFGRKKCSCALIVSGFWSWITKLGYDDDDDDEWLDSLHDNLLHKRIFHLFTFHYIAEYHREISSFTDSRAHSLHEQWPNWDV